MSTKTITPRTTTEEKKAQAAALHASIAEQVDALRGTEQWQRFLDFAQSFHAYSLNNLLLILSQHPDATAVAGFRAWQTKGRQVRKGEHGIHIFGYRQQKVTEQDDNGGELERSVTRFPVLTVFDISQTEPIDGETDSSTLTQPLNGADDFGIIDTLADHLNADGWTIQLQTLPGAKNGYTDPGRRLIVLEEALSPEHAAKTMIHETAHIQLGHINDMAEYVEHRGLMETEAESVAYVVAGMLGIDTSAYSIGYIAGWSEGDTELIKNTATRVLQAAHTLSTILAPNDDETE